MPSTIIEEIGNTSSLLGMLKNRMLTRKKYGTQKRAHPERRRRLLIETLEQRLYLTAAPNEPVIAAQAYESSVDSTPLSTELFTLLADQSVNINGQDGGRTFDGIGAVSAGASSRLLFDYPESARSDILDYLFKPNYGAGIQILKVEIGGDMNSTDGSEPSHMRTPTDLNYDRGYEWWLMKEAKARNPDIILAGLQWGAPGWLQGGFWSLDNIEYIQSWLDGAEQHHGLAIDYVGGWNENGYDANWFIALDQALSVSHPDVKIVAPDHLHGQNWGIADEMVVNQDLLDAVDVVGQHSPGGHRTLYQNYSSTANAQLTGKPLWASEQSSLSHDVGGQAWARGINRAYIDARVTASLNWAPVSAWYANLPIADTGQILAEWPWSGHYKLGSTVWVYAHTTQFTEPGWEYITSASGYLNSGASYVTLKSPDVSPSGRDFSIIIETMDATASSTAEFVVSGGLSTDLIQVWSSNIETDDLSDDFIHELTIVPQNGAFTVTLEPGHVYSLSTTTGQFKGDAIPPWNVANQLPLPFSEDFEGYSEGQLARYFSDINGGFETVQAGGGREGMAYRQMVSQQPIPWPIAGGRADPTTMFGDPRWWGDYEASADVLLEQSGYVELIGRIAAQARAPNQLHRIAGYHLRVDTGGTWELYTQDLHNIQFGNVTLASGSGISFPVGQWHNIALRMEGNRIDVVINDQVVDTIFDSRYTTGNVGLTVSGWQNAQFDNVQVTPTAPTPHFIPQHQISVTATSEHDLFVGGDVNKANYAIDGRPESFWHSFFGQPKPSLPQSLTFDLGTSREVEGLTYQPRIDNNANGMFLTYNVYLSNDGQNFTQVVSNGQWPVSTGTKIAQWTAQQAHYVRFEAINSVNAGNGNASAGEINIISTSPVYLPGDYNQDGAVNAADYIIWRKTSSQSVAPYSGADGSGNGTVDSDDHLVFSTNFGSTLTSGGSGTITSEPHLPHVNEPIETSVSDSRHAFAVQPDLQILANHIYSPSKPARIIAAQNAVSTALDSSDLMAWLKDAILDTKLRHLDSTVVVTPSTNNLAEYSAAIDDFLASLKDEALLTTLNAWRQSVG